MTSDLHSARPHFNACLRALLLLLACSGTTLDQNKPGHTPASLTSRLPTTTCLTTTRIIVITIITINHRHLHQQYHRRISLPSPSLPGLGPPVSHPLPSVLESTRMSLSISPQANLVSSTSIQSTSGPLDRLTFVFAPAADSHSITVHAQSTVVISHPPATVTCSS